MYGSEALELMNSGERLEDPAWLSEALRRWGAEPPPRIPRTAVDQLLALRDLLRRIAARVSAGEPVTEAQLAALNAVVGATPVRARLERAADGGYYVEMTPVTSDWLETAVRE